MHLYFPKVAYYGNELYKKITCNSIKQKRIILAITSCSNNFPEKLLSILIVNKLLQKFGAFSPIF
jgi:hypothetical protein